MISSLRTPTIVSLIGGLCFAAFCSASAVVPTVVAPNYAANMEGLSNSIFPFTPGRSQRYQQLFIASQFASIGAGGLITQIIFRPDTAFGAPFNEVLSDIQINLSTNNRTDQSLSYFFAENVGINDTIVVPRGSLALSSACTGPLDGPKDFDIVINLTIPFFYAPSMGSLLLDVRNFGGEDFFTPFDAVDAEFDGVSSVFTYLTGNANSALADSLVTNGLVTGFTIVPEPRIATILFIGGGLLFASVWKRRFARCKTASSDAG